MVRNLCIRWYKSQSDTFQHSCRNQCETKNCISKSDVLRFHISVHTQRHLTPLPYPISHSLNQLHESWFMQTHTEEPVSTKPTCMTNDKLYWWKSSLFLMQWELNVLPKDIIDSYLRLEPMTNRSVGQCSTNLTTIPPKLIESSIYPYNTIWYLAIKKTPTYIQMVA